MYPRGIFESGQNRQSINYARHCVISCKKLKSLNNNNGESFPAKAGVSAQHHVVKSRVPTTPASQTVWKCCFILHARQLHKMIIGRNLLRVRRPVEKFIADNFI